MFRMAGPTLLVEYADAITQLRGGPRDARADKKKNKREFKNKNKAAKDQKKKKIQPNTRTKDEDDTETKTKPTHKVEYVPKAVKKPVVDVKKPKIDKPASQV